MPLVLRAPKRRTICSQPKVTAGIRSKTNKVPKDRHITRGDPLMQSLHCFGRFNAHHRQESDQFAFRDCGSGQEQLFLGGIFLCHDVMAMVEVVELLG